VPTALPKLVLGQDQAKVNKVMQAMLGMTKIDIATLQHAFEQA
jgi:predicted 3-demethylubiquinone-9 3-methyltransferase (glyoxalase superfamily)